MSAGILGVNQYMENLSTPGGIGTKYNLHSVIMDLSVIFLLFYINGIIICELFFS